MQARREDFAAPRAGAALVGERRVRGRVSCGGGEAMTAKDVIGQGEPMEHGAGLLHAAHGDLAEVPLAQPRVDAFVDGAALVARLAGVALHAQAPGCYARSVALSL